MEEEHVSGVLVPLLTRLIQDEQDSVRLLAVQSSIYICRALDNEQRHVTLLPLLLQNCCSDSSWRVRYVLAEKFVELHEASGSAAGVTGFVDALLKLLRDSEAEVRAAAASVISDFCAGLPEDCKTTIIVEQILPCVKSLSMDASPFVRSALALHIMKLSKTIDPELSMSCLVDLFTTFLADDFPDVRLNAILTLSDICGVLSTSSLSRSIIPSIIGLSEDRQWRVRLSVIEYIPELARRLDDEFSENVGSLCTKWLCDSVHFIRKSTSKTIADLVRLYGATWAKTAIFPALFQMANYQNYLHRMTVLFTIDSLLPVLDSDVIIEDLIPLVIKMAGDPIANVRFNAAKTMGSLIKSLSFKPENIEITLKSLEEDPDPDVRFYANQSLECC
ncbi:serine/threonine-protein phosphatase 2A 65 kDa regulatory subunit A alpha isoform-like [Zophobas morio]|uniref:serine/threonine-protein phosphatase 2A 65 kDa regulatory subunit A alpha isoform-like n=1 Tax=Zophobas morio TaxID=2755281 RepID=UPI003082B736